MTGPGNLPHLPTPTLLGRFKRVNKNTENGQHEALYYIYIFYCRAFINFSHLLYSIRGCFGKCTYACTVFLSQTPAWFCRALQKTRQYIWRDHPQSKSKCPEGERGGARFKHCQDRNETMWELSRSVSLKLSLSTIHSSQRHCKCFTGKNPVL